MKTDYFVEAFGGFNPQEDRDAAMKFCLDSILADDRIGELAELLQEKIGGLGGEPGWVVEWAGSAGTEHIQARVEPTSYSLAHPKITMKRSQFHRYVRDAMHAYIERQRKASSEAKLVLQLASE